MIKHSSSIRYLRTQDMQWHMGIFKVRLIFPLITWNSEKEIFPKMFMAETGSILSNPVASFWSHRLHYPGSLLFHLKPWDKTLANSSAQIDMSPIKTHVLSFMFSLTETMEAKYRENGNTMKWMELGPWNTAWGRHQESHINPVGPLCEK